MSNKPLLKEEITFLMIKPDGVRKGLIGEIINRLERRDLKVVALEMFQPTLEEIDRHYPNDDAWLRRAGQRTFTTYEKYGYNAQAEYGTDDDREMGTMVRQWLIDFMLSAPLVKMAVQGLHAVDMVRKIVGPTMPYLADMGTIRGDFSNDSPLLANKERRAIANLVHASETPEEAQHEIEHWFGKDHKIFSYKRFGVDDNL
jgi:nucleoside-diphosphate kinase